MDVDLLQVCVLDYPNGTVVLTLFVESNIFLYCVPISISSDCPLLRIDIECRMHIHIL